MARFLRCENNLLLDSALEAMPNVAEAAAWLMHGNDPSHDWGHLLRVVDLALAIYAGEEGDTFSEIQTNSIVAAALLHDAFDPKLRPRTTEEEREALLVESMLKDGSDLKTACSILAVAKIVGFSKQIKGLGIAHPTDVAPAVLRERLAEMDTRRFDGVNSPVGENIIVLLLGNHGGDDAQAVIDAMDWTKQLQLARDLFRLINDADMIDAMSLPRCRVFTAYHRAPLDFDFDAHAAKKPRLETTAKELEHWIDQEVYEHFQAKLVHLPKFLRTESARFHARGPFIAMLMEARALILSSPQKASDE